MASNKIIRIGPVALTATLTTNILNPPALTGGVGSGTSNTSTFIVLKHIRISNKTTNYAFASLWIGATGANAAGTEFLGTNQPIPPNSYIDWYGAVRLDSADFLVGGASSASALTFEAEGEIGIA